MFKVIIFSYERPQMLANLLKEFTCEDVVVIDDGSTTVQPDNRIIRTSHEGKRGFWKKWMIAQQIALGSPYDYFLFIQDDVSKVDIDLLKEICRQEWENNYFAINVHDCGRRDCWGHFRTGNPDFEIGGKNFTEVGFVDCMFLTNRKTLEQIPIQPIPDTWFTRPDISSGIGAQLTKRLRSIRARMMTVDACYHGQHESKMHPKPELKVKTYCINLPSRTDKWKETLTEMKQAGMPTPKRFAAIEASPGWVGCRASHLKLLQQLRNEKQFLIIEDDIKMLGSTFDVSACMKELPHNWDALWFGATLNERLRRHSDRLFRLVNGFTTHGIIYNNQNGIVDFILNNCPEGKIDVWFAQVVQRKFNCYICHPMVATQRPGFSDILQRQVDYHEIEARYKQFAK